MPTAEDLAAVPLFADLDAYALAELAGRFEVEEYAAGRTIVSEGDAGYAFYVVADGLARVSSAGQVVRDLGPGEYFGEIAILGKGRRTATVAAVSDLVVWALFGTTFRVLQTARPDVADALRKAMAERLATS